MVVIDGNEVGGDEFRARGFPSPSVHPAIQTLIEGLAASDDLDFELICGSTRLGEVYSEQRKGYRFTIVPAQKLLPGMGSGMLGRLLAIRRYLIQSKPDLVHGQGTEREAALAAVLSGRPSVITLHGNFREISRIFGRRNFDYYWFAAKLETFALQRTSAIFCISNYVKQITECFGKAQFVIPNPVSAKFLQIEPESDRPRPRVICIGTIDARKRTGFILDACEQLWNEGMVFDLAVYGGSPWKSEYYHHFLARLKPWQEKGLASYEFHTDSPEEAIANSDILVSASCEESFGMNVLEAMAVGVPVIAPRIGGIVDIVEDQQTGMLYEVDSLDQCIAALKLLLNSKDQRIAFGRAGKLKARSKFCLEKITKLHILAYKKIHEKKN